MIWRYIVKHSAEHLASCLRSAGVYHLKIRLVLGTGQSLVGLYVFSSPWRSSHSSTSLVLSQRRQK